MDNVKRYTVLESQILESINKGHVTKDEILNDFSGSEKTLEQTINVLIDKNIISCKNDVYGYQPELKGNIIILDGDLLLPVTIITKDDFIFVNRGKWYKFDKDFDVRRIVWNVKLENEDIKNQDLVDLIKTSVVKERKSKIEQLPEYVNLQNKSVPYNNDISLYINVVGETTTEVHIIFKTKIGDNEMSIDHRGFRVRTEISTLELIDVLSKPLDKRNYNDIKINKLYDISDFIFSKNEIPISCDLNSMEFFKITSIKKEIELTFFKMDQLGNTKKGIVETYELADGIDRINELFNKYAKKMLSKLSFSIDEDNNNDS